MVDARAPGCHMEYFLPIDDRIYNAECISEQHDLNDSRGVNVPQRAVSEAGPREGDILLVPIFN
jgi:hypothetical protein